MSSPADRDQWEHERARISVNDDFLGVPVERAGPEWVGSRWIGSKRVGAAEIHR